MLSPGGAFPLTEEEGWVSDESVRDRELELWNMLLNHEGRRELAIDHWSGELTGHAMALARLKVITLGELNKMLDYADAAYSYVIEQRDTHEWMQAMRVAQEKGGLPYKPTEDTQKSRFPADMNLKRRTGES